MDIKIYLDRKGGRYLPYEVDGTLHNCPKRQGKKQEPKKYTLEEVIKKLESIGIIINIDRLMHG